MGRYLVALVLNTQLETQLFPQVFKLNYASSPDEVTVPKRTVLFFFANADVKTAEEFQEAFLAFRIGMKASISCTIPYTIENGGKHYFIGEERNINGVKTIYNPNTHTGIPSMFWGDNYEVIDL